jgi:hypothetical protein
MKRLPNNETTVENIASAIKSQLIPSTNQKVEMVTWRKLDERVLYL